MILYDCDGNNYSYDLSHKIGSGACGTVYKYDLEWVLKYYNEDCSSRNRLKKEIYDITKEINSPYIAEIDKLLFKKRVESLSDDIYITNSIDAYTCSYIKPDKIDILTVSKDYIIDNIRELSDVFLEFSDRGVRALDVKEGNVIIQNDKVTLIDLDLFYKACTQIDILEIENYRTLMKLFEELMLSSAICYSYGKEIENGIYQLFDVVHKPSDIEDMQEVLKYLNKYQYPIDAIKVYTKNRFF